MRLDGLLEVEVAVDLAERKARLGSGKIEPGHLPEAILPRGRPDLLHGRAAGDLEAAGEPADLGVDDLAALLHGERQALVPVDHEVGMVDLVDEDRHVCGVRPRRLDLHEDLA